MAGNNNTQTQLPNDINSRPVQVLAPDEANISTEASIGNTNSRVAIPAASEIVEVCVTGNCYMKFGTSSVDASVTPRRALTAGVYVYAVPPGANNVAFIQIGAATGLATVGRLF